MELRDGFARTISYLRVSVTDRCDLRCRYCLPKDYRAAGEPEEWLRPAQLQRLVGAFLSLGVRHVRLTGGEPLVRRDLLEIARRLSGLNGLSDLSLSTNGMRLARLAEPLRAAGLGRVNVSLDTLNAARFRELTGGRLEKVLEGLERARASGFSPIRINCVLMRGVNDDELEDLLDYCVARDFTLRLIETMPMGAQGQHALRHYLPLDEARRRLARGFDLVPDVAGIGAGPARYYRLPNSNARIGFITPLSQHFCASCNRVRLGPDGMLYLCLGDEHRVDLGAAVRRGASDEALQQEIRAALAQKPERHLFNEAPGRVVRFMGVTGG